MGKIKSKIRMGTSRKLHNRDNTLSVVIDNVG